MRPLRAATTSTQSLRAASQRSSPTFRQPARAASSSSYTPKPRTTPSYTAAAPAPRARVLSTKKPLPPTSKVNGPIDPQAAIPEAATVADVDPALAAAIPTPTTTAPPTDPLDDELSVWTAKARALRALSSSSPSASAIVNVIITSPLVDASAPPVAARRRLNQTVQAFLEAWLDRAGDSLPPPRPKIGELFLTWKGRKVYGGSSLASMGVRVDGEGRVKVDGAAGGEGYYKGGIHLEVWNESLYADFLLERGRRRAREITDGLEPGYDSDGCPIGGGDDDAEELLVEEQPKRKGIRIVLKAKDHEPLKLTTRDETNVETLVEAFRTQRGVGEEWEVSVWFDGERLGEETLVTEIDIDPDEANQLEVHVKKRD
ncbi:hypothetical protein C8A05DRAFT_19820 [Staphylotrichum tortipilum]|uniref:Rad60/SUMO-like domain-containing protein n=1 Tax=Staphylotrichum tortipilum TaxID=2831512 RepID=A0AAN6MAI4_9PEZI|nr:hypothetical protein C8A05DRAFT_19820 [Staphylotrichum longicolle]